MTKFHLQLCEIVTWLLLINTYMYLRFTFKVLESYFDY